jgi:ribosomal protein S18 acetylase RimI-like enzyme
MVVEDAREFGYKTLLLDSLPSMENAKELYTSLGFKKLDGTKKPVKTVVHLSLPL